MAVLILSAAVAVAALAALVASQIARGRRRLLTQRVAIYTALPAITAVLVLLPLQLKLTFSDGLSLAGLVLSLGFGVGARAMERMTSRLRVGVVIPSSAPFNSELRMGLTEALSPVRLDLYDDYLVTNRAVERLSEFLPGLRRTLAWRPDYLVVYSPSVPLVSTEQVLTLIREFIRKGGGVVFIDNEPTEHVRSTLGKHYGRVTSDVETGARIVADYVRSHMGHGDEVLVLSGPPASEPAVLRQKTLTDALPGATILVADTGGWTSEAAYAATMTSFAGGASLRFIVCGNDVMGFGAVKAVREVRSGAGKDNAARTEVIGYDGIARALFCIAEDGNPFAATLSTPPAAYGHEVAAMILADAQRVLRWRSVLSHNVIPVGDGQLISRYNISLVLEG